MGTKRKKRKTLSCGTLTYRYLSDFWKDTEVLLIKQHSHRGNWGIPKGHLDAGETVEQCAIRETKEETGIDVILDVRLQDTIAHYKNEVKTVVTFIAQPTSTNKPRSNDPDSEVADTRWFKVTKLPPIHPYQLDLMKEGLDIIYFRFRTELTRKQQSTHDGAITDALNNVFQYASHVDDWLTIKKELLKMLPSDSRRVFSTRDPLTKRQRTNDYERTLANRWSELTGRPVLFREDDDPNRTKNSS